MVVSPQRLTRWPSYVRDRHAAITYTTPRDAPAFFTAAVTAVLAGPATVAPPADSSPARAS
ncbi:hypothetical protein CKJ62_09310 [Mycobacterium avium]|nr:hypothetical protein CKJ62_09310 [Mycobacterium avium]